MPYLKSLSLNSIPQLKNEPFEVHLAENEEDFKHLILTGPNGSGKTTILELIAKQIAWMLQKSPELPPSDLKDVHLQWVAPSPPIIGVARYFEDGTFVVAYLDAMRTLDLLPVKGPQELPLEKAGIREQLAPKFVQYLVNQKAQQGFASVEKDQLKVEELSRWFEQLEENLRGLFGQPELQLDFDAPRFKFFLRLPDGRRYTFSQMADGHSAVLAIFAEILLRLEGGSRDEGASEQLPTTGVVLIDELETHLHIELQEQILPFLTHLFPQIQFIIATHSPAIIASVDNAVVFDLESQVTVESKKLRGVPYGTLMKGHFGIETDFDLESTRLLKRLALLNQKKRSPEEQKEFEALAERLSGTTHPLALEVWNKVNFASLFTQEKQDD